jgi:hypothetical protein
MKTAFDGCFDCVALCANVGGSVITGTTTKRVYPGPVSSLKGADPHGDSINEASRIISGSISLQPQISV